MAITMKVENKNDLESATKAYLIAKGVDSGSAEYLAKLFAESERGKKVVEAGAIVPLGNCTLLGLSPG